MKALGEYYVPICFHDDNKSSRSNSIIDPHRCNTFLDPISFITSELGDYFELKPLYCEVSFAIFFLTILFHERVALIKEAYPFKLPPESYLAKAPSQQWMIPKTLKRIAILFPFEGKMIF